MYSNAMTPHNALLESFLSPLQQSKSGTEMVSYIMANIAPVLLKGLVALAKVVEKDPTQDEVNAPYNDTPTDVEQDSMELRIFFAKEVNRQISLGLENTFRAKPADPLDHLSSFLFAASADEVLNPELDEQTNPLQYLAQYLYRNNPLHQEASPLPPPSSLHEQNRPLIPPVPIPVGPGPHSVNDGKPNVYSTPHAQKGLVSADQTKEVIGCVDLTIPNLGPNGTPKHVTITAIRHIANKTVLFRAIDQTSYKRYDRLLNEEQLRLFASPAGTSDVGFAGAVRELLSKATLVRVCRGMQISFENVPELALPPPTLFQTSKNFLGRMFIVDVLSEPPLATGSNQGETRKDPTRELLLLRCRMYDPEHSRYYEASTHADLSIDVPERRKEVDSLIKRLEIVETDEHTGRPMRFGFSEPAAEESKEEAKAAPPLASPRLRSAFKDAKSFDIALNSATDKIKNLPLSDLSSSSAFDRDELDARESVWRLRRDHALLQKRNFLQKRFGKNSAQAKGDVSVVVFRRGMRISGRRVIASIECFAESLNGTLRFGVYDPATSEAHECVAQHRDTRGMLEGRRTELHDMCKNLRLVKLKVEGGEGALQLILFEKDEWTTKLRKAWEVLPKDFSGRVTRANVLDCLEECKRGVVSYLEGIHDPMLQFAITYLESVMEYARNYAWPVVAFDEFKKMLDEAGEGGGGAGVEGGTKRGREEGKEEEKGGEGKED